jgi:hypothetical protein
LDFDTPIVASPRARRKGAIIPERDPTKWVDEWPLPGLSLTDRTRIKSQLLKAHAIVLRTGGDPYKFIRPMQQAFDGIANILFESNLLTLEILESQLRLFVLEAAIAGDWIAYFTHDEPRTEIIPGYFGNATMWRKLQEYPPFPRIFLAEIAEWRSKLLDKSLETAVQQPTVDQQDRKALRDAYFAAFRGTKVLDLCWAANQRYSEWKRWLRNVLKPDWSADRAFRAILTSGKTPKDYRKQPRPRGWK